MTQSKKVVAYIRKSTSGTDLDGRERQEGSFERQKAAVLDYAKRHQMEVLRWYEEPASGKSIRKRKIFLQLVKEAKSPGRLFQAIIFGEYDRFMRDIKEAMRYEVELDDAGIELHFTNLRNDGSLQDEMIKSMVRNMAAEYSRELARKVLQGEVRKAKKGCWLGGMPPFGYRAFKDSQGENKLVLHEKEAETVKEIFNLSLKGYGRKSIAISLNERGIPSSEVARKRNSILHKNPDGRWSGDSIKGILKNPVYKGVYRWNKRARVDCFDWDVEGNGTIEIRRLRTENSNFIKNGKNTFNRNEREFYVDRTKPRDKWIEIEGAVPAIVSSEVFDKVQERFRNYSRIKWRRSNNTKYLMSDSLRCSNCGNGIFGERRSKVLRSTGQREFYYYYRCSGDLKKSTHSGPNRPMMVQSAIDKVVFSEISERLEKLSDLSKVKELFSNRVKEYLGERPNRLTELENQIKKVNGEIDRLITAYTKFEAPIPEDKIRELKERKKALEEERDSLTDTGYSEINFDLDSQTRNFLSSISKSKDIIEKGDSIELRKIRKLLLDNGEVDWSGQLPEVRLYWYSMPAVCDSWRAPPPPPISTPILGTPLSTSRAA